MGRLHGLSLILLFMSSMAACGESSGETSKTDDKQALSNFKNTTFREEIDWRQVMPYLAQTQLYLSRCLYMSKLRKILSAERMQSEKHPRTAGTIMNNNALRHSSIYSDEGSYRCDGFQPVISTIYDNSLTDKTRSGISLVVGVDMAQRAAMHRPGALPPIHDFGSSGNIAYHAFDNWVNSFTKEVIYPSTPKAAQTVRVGLDESSAILARAVVIGRNDEGLQVLELHYSSSSGEPYDPIFKSLSTFTGIGGLKVSESDTLGSKEQEYYPVWPVDDAPLLAAQFQ